MKTQLQQNTDYTITHNVSYVRFILNRQAVAPMAAKRYVPARFGRWLPIGSTSSMGFPISIL